MVYSQKEAKEMGSLYNAIFSYLNVYTPPLMIHQIQYVVQLKTLKTIFKDVRSIPEDLFALLGVSRCLRGTTLALTIAHMMSLPIHTQEEAAILRTCACRSDDDPGLLFL